jgi:hypothetical protein
MVAGPTSQRGAILLLSMICLLLIAMVAGTTMHTSILELRMAGNDQFREEAFQKAQAVATALMENPDNFPVAGLVGYTVCASGSSDPGCDATTISVPAAVTSAPAGVAVDYRVERQGPLIVPGLPFRQSQSSTSSSLAFDSAFFEAQVTVDGGAVSLGRSEVAQGVGRVIASAGQ